MLTRSCAQLLLIAATLALLGLTLACGGGSPSAPNQRATAPARGAQPVVLAISPSRGSTILATPVLITGTGFQLGATVTLDGFATDVVVVSSTAITATAAVHTAGTIDVVVTNPVGQSGKLPGGFTYEIPAPGPRPTITGLSARVGSMKGGTPLVLTGSGFSAGAVLMFDGVPTRVNIHDGDFYWFTRAHPAGQVDVVVTNPDGQSDRLAGGYTFVFPGSLDINGQWEGRAGEHWDFVFRFTVENDTVTSASCDRSAEIRFSSPPSTNTGEFLAAERGVTLLTGEFFSPAYALGEIDMAPCTRTRWEAWKR